MSSLKYSYPVPCLLLNNQKIDEGTCFDIHVVVDGTTPKEFAPKEIIDVKNYEDVCYQCKYHR